jgi:hypothetical protein
VSLVRVCVRARKRGGGGAPRPAHGRAWVREAQRKARRASLTAVAARARSLDTESEAAAPAEASTEESSSESSESAAPSESAAAASSSSSSSEPAESADEETAARTVRELTGPKGGKITIVANKNTLTHVNTETPPTDFMLVEEQTQKENQARHERKLAEDKKNSKKEDDQKDVERQRVAKEKKDEEDKKAKEKEEQEKKIAEEKEKKELEQKAKEAEQKAEQEKKKEERQKEEGAKKEAAEKKAAEEKSKADKAAEEKEKADKKKAEEEEKARSQVRLESGWQNYGGGYEINTVFKWNRYVFVEGLIRGHAGFIGTLPDDSRPTSGRLIFGVMKGHWNARVDVLPDGRIFWIVAGSSDWITLNGISFDAQWYQSLWTYNSWSNYGHGYRGAMESKQDALCMISGLVSGWVWNWYGRVNGWCYPNSGQLIFNANNHENVVRMDVTSDGWLVRNGGSANHGWVSFDGMAWTQHGGNDLSLFNGWHNYWSGYRPGRYMRTGQICVLTGLLNNGNWWSGHITTLPTDCRPRRRLVFGVNNHNGMARVDVLPSGEVHYVANRQGHSWLPLDGIKFVAY